MRQKVNSIYRNAAEEFARRVIAILGRHVHAIVLYGSVARNQAKRDSDVDVLIVGDGRQISDRVADIGYELMESSQFETFISVVYFTKPEFQELIQLGSPFISTVLQEGLIQYDDGTFSGVRERVPARG